MEDRSALRLGEHRLMAGQVEQEARRTWYVERPAVSDLPFERQATELVNPRPDRDQVVREDNTAQLMGDPGDLSEKLREGVGFVGSVREKSEVEIL